MNGTTTQQKIPLAVQLRCAQRELAMRRKVYPGWIAAGRLKQDVADAELAAMAAIVETLKELQDGGQRRMFE